MKTRTFHVSLASVVYPETDLAAVCKCAAAAAACGSTLPDAPQRMARAEAAARTTANGVRQDYRVADRRERSKLEREASAHILHAAYRAFDA